VKENKNIDLGESKAKADDAVVSADKGAESKSVAVEEKSNQDVVAAKDDEKTADK